ncbi:Glycine/D-amino acid oxidases (deaminating) [Archaeoglobus sulfaticallidus PM70-1]|uniref:Glycine/D-amino acid oxidases (Deaminating) n=1 Tax=Archaeoglobus sulfaticallidus PM70-1 TaxID=387631 RepID=N0BLJ7_9EURY|nr:FAD-binding oxidoreductase [Archaeoglobus sulfaticallidus]AGK61075.1 Glycine/D-amino acid oxidases (deaminating) [Archaeoglobus sulfaticallidus PM70-1]
MKVGVIGAGVAGLFSAYFLAKNGAEVTVFEKRYPLYGASGRNSGGITPMLGRKELVKLAKRSIEIYDRTQSEVRFNFLFRKDGYLKVAKTDEDMDKLEKEARMQKELGVKLREIDEYELKSLVDGFNTKSVVGAFYGEGGVIFPWPVIWGLERGCKSLGVEIIPQKEVSVEVSNSRISVKAGNGEEYKFDFVLNCSGAWSASVNRSLGLRCNRIVKEEICVLESLKPFIDPYIMNVSDGVYLSQSARGEVVGGIIGSEVDSPKTSSSLSFLTKYAKLAVEMIPKLKGLSVLRQWAGVYDSSGDGLPVVGEDKVEGIIQLNGLGRQGMCIAPALGEIVADIILKGKEYEKFSPKRFA